MRESAIRRPPRSHEGDRITGASRLYAGWLDLVLLRLHLNGRDEQRPLVRHPHGAAVLAYDPERRVAIVVRQTRAAVLLLEVSPVMEVVAGVVERGDPVASAYQEAWEEAGLRLRGLAHVGCVMMNPSTSTEKVDLFLAEYVLADRIGEGGGLEEENERIEVREAGLDSLWSELEAAGLADAKTLILFQALRMRRPELFGDTGHGLDAVPSFPGRSRTDPPERAELLPGGNPGLFSGETID